MELVGLVIESTEVAYLKSFSYVVVIKTFQVTCGVASFRIKKTKSAQAPLNRDASGLLPDAYLYLVRKKAANW